MCGRPDGLRQVAEIEAAAPECRVTDLRERREAARRSPLPRRRAERAGTGRQVIAGQLLEQRSPARPSTASLARCSYVARPAAPIRRRRSGSAASRSTASAQRQRDPRRGTSSAFSPSRQELACGRGVGRHERDAAGERLKGLVRDHPCGLRSTSRRSRARSPAAAELAAAAARSRPIGDVRHVGRGASERRLELAAADDTKRDLGNERAAARIVSSPCSGISLPTKSAWNGCRGAAARCENRRSSAPTRQTRTRRVREAEPLDVELGLRLGVCDDARRPPGTRRDRSQERPAGERAWPESARDPGRGCRRARRAGRTRPVGSRAAAAQPGGRSGRDSRRGRRRRPVASPKAEASSPRRASLGQRSEARPTRPRAARPRPDTCRSATSTPAARRQDRTCALRG